MGLYKLSISKNLVLKTKVFATLSLKFSKILSNAFRSNFSIVYLILLMSFWVGDHFHTQLISLSMKLYSKQILVLQVLQ